MTDKSTRAAVAPPPKKQTITSFLPESSTEEPVEAADNMKDDRPVGMTFNMPHSWHMQFKMAAAAERMPMSKFLVKCFDAWKREQKRGNS